MEIRENEFDADAFMLLWNAVWDGAPAKEQVQLALEHSIFRVGVYDGDRIAQMIIQPYERAKVQVVKELTETERGAGGFGSTGR